MMVPLAAEPSRVIKGPYPFGAPAGGSPGYVSRTKVVGICTKKSLFGGADVCDPAVTVMAVLPPACLGGIVKIACITVPFVTLTICTLIPETLTVGVLPKFSPFMTTSAVPPTPPRAWPPADATTEVIVTPAATSTSQGSLVSDVTLGDARKRVPCQPFATTLTVFLLPGGALISAVI